MAFFISLQPWDKEVVDKTIVISDAIGYNQLALSLVTNKSFNHFDNLRTPGYPVFIALIYDISNESVWFVLFVQILLSLISVFLVFKIASKIFSENIALLSAFLFAIDINQAYYTLTLLTETLFVTLFISSARILFISSCCRIFPSSFYEPKSKVKSDLFIDIYCYLYCFNFTMVNS